MIDICMVVYNNYDIADMVVSNMNRINGEYRLLIGDNSPNNLLDRHKKFVEMNDRVEVYPLVYYGGVDGEIHGAALDKLVEYTTTDIVGTMDSDFFWTNPDILNEVVHWFDMGYKAVGCAGGYPVWYRNIDKNNPKRAGFLAPVCWGQFLSRQIALENTFVVSGQDLNLNPFTETGWKIREHIINNAIPSIIYPPFAGNRSDTTNLTYFGVPGMTYGVHILRGSNSDFAQQGFSYEEIQGIVDASFEQWV